MRVITNPIESLLLLLVLFLLPLLLLLLLMSLLLFAVMVLLLFVISNCWVLVEWSKCQVTVEVWEEKLS